MKSIKNISIVCLCIVAIHFQSTGGTIIRYDGSDQILSQRWKWAFQKADEKGWTKNYWVGFSIQRMMPENSFIGSWSSNPANNKPSLAECIYGIKIKGESGPHGSSGESTFEGYCNDEDDNNQSPKVLKEIGVLFHFGDGAELTKVVISNLSLRVALHDDPLIWVNSANDSECISMLQRTYSERISYEVQKEIVGAVGMVGSGDLAFLFLKDVLTGHDQTSVRKDAAFWLGQQNTIDGVRLLSLTAKEDPSKEMKEESVFGLSQMTLTEATDALIDLARAGNDIDTRKKAMFWLGQKASEKGIKTLGDIANDNDDVEIQKGAIFALSELPDNQGVEPLITVAKTHPNSAVRKNAIFWLSQSDDKRALDALIDIVKQ